jgi:3-oxoacyl-(acyl-carrier-protein) synthase
MPPCLISVLEGIRGPNLIFTPWEGQTAAALVEGWLAVATGEVDCALVGAADTAAYPSTFVYLRQAGCLADDEYPSSGAAYLVLEPAESALRDGVRIHARIRRLTLDASATIEDPLSGRIGRTFAAAPAVLMALAAGCGMPELSVCGVDGQRFSAQLEATP